VSTGEFAVVCSEEHGEFLGGDFFPDISQLETQTGWAEMNDG